MSYNLQIFAPFVGLAQVALKPLVYLAVTRTLFKLTRVLPELPWDQPTLDQREYVAWRDQETERVRGPWKRVENLPLSLLRKVLAPSPPKRYTIQQIRNHIWFKNQFRDAGNCPIPGSNPFLLFDFLSVLLLYNFPPSLSFSFDLQCPIQIT